MIEKYKQLQVLHRALCGGVALFMVFAAFLKIKGMLPFAGTDQVEIFSGVGVLTFFATAIASRIIYSNQLQTIDQSLPAEQKLDAYRGAFIIRISLLEGGAIINLLMFMLKASWLSLGICFFALVLMILSRPNVVTLREALHLSADEQAELSQAL